MKYFFFLFLIFGCFVSSEIYAQTSTEKEPIIADPVEKIYDITEYQAYFPGGGIIRNNYFRNFINKRLKELKSDSTQFCYLRFVVDKEGNISQITTRNKTQTKLEEILIEALNKGPKWNPARKNGEKVSAYTSLTYIFEPKISGKKTYSRNSINYFTTKENSDPKNFQKILVLVAGTVPIRIFTDQLYESLKVELDKNLVETEYLFLGNDYKVAQKNFLNLTNSKTFDGVLLFLQDDAATIRENYYSTEISAREISLKQSIKIYLLEPGDLETSVLEAKIFMNYNLMKKSAYLQASKELLSILDQNKIISLKKKD